MFDTSMGKLILNFFRENAILSKNRIEFEVKKIKFKEKIIS